MKFVNLGKTGTKVSELCLGCMSFGESADWMVSEDVSRAILRRAIEAGINFFDTANVYSRGESEEILGRALREFKVSRDHAVVATKVYFPMGDSPNERGLSRKNIFSAIDASLKRLGMDYVDLYQIHRFDYETPMEETLDALHDVVKSGKARYIGASSMFAWQFAQYLALADRYAKTRFVTMQNHYNLAYREEEREMNPLCLAEGVGLIPWSPLAGGFLAGNRRAGTVRAQSRFYNNRYQRPADAAVLAAVESVAEKHRVTSAQVALRWLLSKPAVTAPIIGITRLEQLDDLLKVSELTLDKSEIEALEAPYEPQAVVGAL